MARRPKQHIVPADQLARAEEEIVERSRRIEFYMTEYSVELLAEKMAREELVIPAYQREFTWEPARKSRFIESLVMGLPIPFLFFWEMENGKLEIVDGSQRLRTLQEYILGDLQLIGLEALPSLNGTRFSDLSPSRQRKIKNRSIRGIILNEHADDQARFDMFERINTGSKQANTAEVRRGALRGPFLDLVVELARLPLFSQLAPVSGKSQRERIPEELVTRFFAYGDGLDDYKENPAQFLFEYTRRMNEAFEADAELINVYRERFTRMLDFVQRAFPLGFRKPSNPNSTPRARFEAIAIGTHRALEEKPDLFDDPPNTDVWLNGDEFGDVTTSDAANVKSKLIRRIDFVKQALVGEE